jgi:hypothetical protein
VNPGRDLGLAHSSDRLCAERACLLSEVEARVAEEIVDVGDDSSRCARRAGQRPGTGNHHLLLLFTVTDREATAEHVLGKEDAARHAERLDHELARRVLVRLNREDLEDATGDVEARVAVRPDLTERGQLRQSGDLAHDPLEGVLAAARVGEVIAEPASGVGEEVAHGDACRDVGLREPKLGQIAADRGVEVELALLDELHGDRAGHRLRDRADLEQRGRVDVERVLDARGPQPATASAPSCSMPIAAPGTPKRSSDSCAASDSVSNRVMPRR